MTSKGREKKITPNTREKCKCWCHKTITGSLACQDCESFHETKPSQSDCGINHNVCNTALKKYGGKATCCFCNPSKHVCYFKEKPSQQEYDKDHKILSKEDKKLYKHKSISVEKIVLDCQPPQSSECKCNCHKKMQTCDSKVRNYLHSYCCDKYQIIFDYEDNTQCNYRDSLLEKEFQPPKSDGKRLIRKLKEIIADAEFAGCYDYDVIAEKVIKYVEKLEIISKE